MDYEKKYRDAIKYLKTFIDGDCVTESEILADFPELKESEDERIRKALIDYFKGGRQDFMSQDAVAWLEKQKEPENVSASTMAPSCWQKEQKPYEPKNWPADKDTLTQEQKPAEWSEEDSEMLMRIINQVGGYTYFAGMDSERVVNWLKSLRPSWKPSEEQMNELHDMLIPGKVFDCDILATLYNDLKKLMED